MLSRRIIPCLDVNAGRVVKGVRFQELRDAGDPVQCARAYDAQGADELVFLDITASSDNRGIMRDVVAATAEQCFMPLTVGGGLRTVADIEAMLRAGADKVSLNTAAIQNPSLIREASDRFGAQCIVLAIDAKRQVGLDILDRVVAGVGEQRIHRIHAIGAEAARPVSGKGHSHRVRRPSCFRLSGS